jgi:hypothetical protein
MNVERRWARRYHWLGDDVKDVVCEPHKAVCCDHTAKVLNMVAQESAPCRAASASLAAEDPDKVVAEFAKIETLELPRRHEVSLSDIKAKNLRKILQRTYEAKPCDFESLIGTEGVGPKTVRALALISELVYGRPASCRDPARFSFAHGGKDGHPYPVDRAQYDLSIETLKCAVNLAKVGRSEKLKALRRLGEWYR